MQQQQEQLSEISPIERVVLVLERATPQQQEALFQKIRATPEQRQQLLSKVHDLQMLRQQLLLQQQRQQEWRQQSQQLTSFPNPAPPLRMMSAAGKRHNSKGTFVLNLQRQQGAWNFIVVNC